MFKRSLSSLSVCAALLASSAAVANDACDNLVDPVAQLSCWISGPGTVVQPMGPGSGGTGGKDEEEKVKTE